MRKWLPYELNHLIKYGFSVENLERYGEKPVECITGKAIFSGLEFEVSPDVLIPRAETEEMVTLALEFLGRPPRSSKVGIADVGCGGGCLGISLARKLEERNCDFDMTLSDISQMSLNVAKNNAKRLLTNQSNLTFIESDLLDNSKGCPKFDLVLANLPYIPTARLAKLDKSVINFEPLFALDGGLDGLVLIKKLLKQLPDYLTEDGLAILEIDETHKLSDFSQFPELKFEVKKDQFGKNRFLLVRRRRRV